MLNPIDYYVDPDICVAERLPAETLVNKEWLEREIEKVFRRSWLILPKSQPQKAGGQTAVEVFNHNILLQRDNEKKLRAFANICTHDGMPLASEKRCVKKIICPYHGRAFGLDGKYISQPGFQNVKNIEQKNFDLIRRNIAEWGPFAFIAIKQPTATFGKFFEAIFAHTEKMPLAELKLVADDERPQMCFGNWKYHISNYSDELHLRFIHGGIGGLVDETRIETYTTELFEFASLRWVYAKDPKDGFDPDMLPERFFNKKNPKRRVFGLWWVLFPNTTLNIYKWGISVNTYFPILDSPRQTLFFVRHYAWDEIEHKRISQKWYDMRVDKEDLGVISKVDHALGSAADLLPRSCFSPEWEKGRHWFDRLIYKTMFEI